MTLRSAWMQTRSRLERAGIDDTVLEAEVILRHALGIDRAAFFAALEEQPDGEALRLADSLAQRREQGEPLAYILGHREFYGLDILVTPAVLIPRQETELLVDSIIEFAAGRPDIAIADVGTGSRRNRSGRRRQPAILPRLRHRLLEGGAPGRRRQLPHALRRRTASS